MKTKTRNYLEKNARQIRTFGYGMIKDALDMFGTLNGGTYYILANGDTYQRFNTPGEPMFAMIGTTIRGAFVKLS